METQDRKFIIAYCDVDDNTNGIELDVVYGNDELDAMLYFLDNPEVEALTWSSPEQLQDWVWDEWGALINYIEV
jgi:hypothetical protein